MSGPVDVLASLGALSRNIRSRAGRIGVPQMPARDADTVDLIHDAVSEVITELRNAHEIIKLVMNHVPASARTPWLLAIDDAGLCGDGVTRFHERKAALANVGSAS